MSNVQYRMSNAEISIFDVRYWIFDICLLRCQPQRICCMHPPSIDGDNPQVAPDPSSRLITIVAGPRIPRLPGGEDKASNAVDISEVHHVPHRRTLGTVKRGHELVRRTDVHSVIAATQREWPDVEPRQGAEQRDRTERVLLSVRV